MDIELHYFSLLIPWVEPSRSTPWHPTERYDDWSVITRGNFASIEAAHTWAAENLCGAPYGVTEFGCDEEQGAWSRVVVPVPRTEIDAPMPLRVAA